MTSPVYGYSPNGGVTWARDFPSIQSPSEMAEAQSKIEKEKKGGWPFRRKSASKKKKLGEKFTDTTETSFVEDQGASPPPPVSPHQPPHPSDRSLLKNAGRSQSVGGRSSKPERVKPPKHEKVAVTSSGSQVCPPTGPAVNPQFGSQGSPPRNLEGEVPMKELKVMFGDACKMGCR